MRKSPLPDGPKVYESAMLNSTSMVEVVET
jgi:hypothetical protein